MRASLLLFFALPLAAQMRMTIKHDATQGDCIASPCSSSINIPFDSQGTPAPSGAGPGYWGTQGSALTSISFEGLPAGFSVQLLRIRWNLMGWIRGLVPASTQAGILWSLQTTASLQAGAVDNVQYGTNGCFLYPQMVFGVNVVSPLQVETDLSKDNIVLPDGVMWSKEAVFLNNTGLHVHIEATWVTVYQFVKQ